MLRLIQKKLNINRYLDNALQKLENIGSLYKEGHIQTKRAIIGSIFTEKLEFDGSNYRTTRMNSVSGYILLINRKLCEKENRKNDHLITYPVLYPAPIYL